MKFTHFHVHSQYSILDGAASIPGLVGKAIADGMTAIALTDHGNMFGIKLFYDTCKKKGIKPILGCEAYVARVSRFNNEKPIDRSGEHLILLAKNLTGYKNLVKLTSAAYVDGYYYRPRIDKELLEQYHEGLIVSSTRKSWQATSKGRKPLPCGTKTFSGRTIIWKSCATRQKTQNNGQKCMTTSNAASKRR